MAFLDFEKPIIEIEKKIKEFKNIGKDKHVDFSSEINKLEKKCLKLKKEIFSKLSPWQKVQLSRHPDRPYTMDYIKGLMFDFIELHGDRNFADDKAIIGGVAFFGKEPVVVIGHQKGRSLQENKERNFAMPHPEGYGKALKLMQLANKFGRTVIIFIDTPGAYPGIAAEERGQAESIATNLKEMAGFGVPILCVVIGEGGSGGALAVGVGNKVVMLENAIYSVISPEGCASILWRDSSEAKKAAEKLALTAPDLLRNGIIDEIIPEPLGGAHCDYNFVIEQVRKSLIRNIAEFKKFTSEELIEQRYNKFRKIGQIKTGKGKKPISQSKQRKKQCPKGNAK
ncbi:acetyl-CoA carboxylase carboxyltransferase subunit alpha [bacterium]|nr:acetyl-CoA carboxylase carboxyltransferase subunit alpha [bacterium]